MISSAISRVAIEPAIITLSGLTIVVPLTVDYLVSAGGGGGASGYGGIGGGGGGAGGLRSSYGNSAGTPAWINETTLTLTPGTNYSVTVGAGSSGASYTDGGQGTSGSNSVFHSITSVGGGYARSYSAGGGSSANGGSGGGAKFNGGPGPANGSSGGSNNSNSPSSGWGNPGGTGQGGNPWAGGGGGVPRAEQGGQRRPQQMRVSRRVWPVQFLV